jgi:hypothetical protein
MMKFFVLAAVFAGLVSQTASAEEFVVPCNFEHYKTLNTALNELTVRSGQELKEEVKGVLAQEMGPTCELVIELKVGIPGQSSQDFRLQSESNEYLVTIVKGGVEANNASWLVISKSDLKK